MGDKDPKHIYGTLQETIRKKVSSLHDVPYESLLDADVGPSTPSDEKPYSPPKVGDYVFSMVIEGARTGAIRQVFKIASITPGKYANRLEFKAIDTSVPERDPKVLRYLEYPVGYWEKTRKRPAFVSRAYYAGKKPLIGTKVKFLQ